MNSYRALSALLFLVVAPLSFLFAARASADDSVAVSNVVLRCAGGPIRAEVFEQRPPKRRPVVLVLHGAGGTLFDGPEMRHTARYLAGTGYAAYVVHYFDRTGTLFARDFTMQRHFETWLQTVHEAIPAIQELRGNTDPVGIFGYSLGAFLSILTASDNPRVAAIVEHAGGVWNGKLERVEEMPAVLMVHGESDARVPFAKYAQPLLPVLRKHAVRVETRFFPGEAHGFSAPALLEVHKAAAEFFRRNLHSKA
jgi:dienelactone hydrolase